MQKYNHEAQNVYTVSIRLDAEVAAGEERALLATLAQWQAARERIQERLDALQRVRNQRERSPHNRIYGLWQDERLTELVGQINEEIGSLLRQMGDLAIIQQEVAMLASTSHAKQLALMQLKAPESDLATTWNALPRQAFLAQVGFLGDGSPLLELLTRIAGETTEKARAVLLDAIAQGWGARKTAKALYQVTDASLGRALLIARTETARAYREAAHMTFEANAEVLTGWMWVASLDKRTCAGCLAKHGSIHPTTERLMDHPAGRCVAVPVTQESPLLDEPPPSADAWLRKLSERDQVLILGSEEARQAWLTGKVSLEEFAGVRRSPRWGDSVYRRSLKEIHDTR